MLYVVNIKTGKVAQRGSLEDDLWVWLDEVAGLDRKVWSVWSHAHIVSKFKRISWERK